MSPFRKGVFIHRLSAAVIPLADGHAGGKTPGVEVFHNPRPKGRGNYITVLIALTPSRQLADKGWRTKDSGL